MARPGGLTLARAMLFAGLALFVAAMAALVIVSLGRRRVTAYALSPAAALQPAGDEARMVTLDARDARAWTFLDLATGRAVDGVSPPPMWDVAVRRHEIRVGHAAADLGGIAFDSVRRAPASGWIETRPAGDTTNAALGKWYRYDYSSHVLESREHVYVVRDGNGGFVKLQVAGYYCPGPEAGCLTLRYARVAPP